MCAMRHAFAFVVACLVVCVGLLACLLCGMRACHAAAPLMLACLLCCCGVAHACRTQQHSLFVRALMLSVQIV